MRVASGRVLTAILGVVIYCPIKLAVGNVLDLEADGKKESKEG